MGADAWLWLRLDASVERIGHFDALLDVDSFTAVDERDREG